jgi:SAM-dependent methyltransferase
MAAQVSMGSAVAEYGVSKFGHDAETVRRLQAAPLYGIDGFAFQGGEATLVGMALSPEGDPRKVSVTSDPGVSLSLEFPLRNPDAADVYWYWPNAADSYFRATLDLAETTRGGPYYRLRVRFEGQADDRFEDIRTTIVVPKHMNAYQNYPTGGSLQRVQFFDTIAGVTVRGASDALRIARLAQAYGVDPAGAVLDWGVGHGRVLRHMPLAGMTGRLHGVDIDPDNIAWAGEHLKTLDMRVGPLMPPSPYADDSFDLVYGISVMTHLTRHVQEAWLAEIARILKPGGVALLTFSGDTAVAFQSYSLTADWLAVYLETGAGPDLPDNSLVGVIDDPSYYKNVYLTADRAAELCGRFLEVAGVHPCMFGYQDLMALRKPG